MNFVAMSMSGAREDKEGFVTEDEAWEYISGNFLCSGCREDLKNGGFYLPEENDFVVINHVSQTACAACWDVVSKEEYDNLIKGEG